jgi:hypothetical protein
MSNTKFLRFPNNKYGSIIFPPGFAGNHLRWILFLDSKFDSTDLCKNTIQDKLDFIQTKIYTQERSWWNWLDFEWCYRVTLDQHIEICHANFDWEQTSNKELYLTTIDQNLPFYHYYHFNLGLNNKTPEQYKQSIAEWVKEFEFVKTQINRFPNKKISACDSLFRNTLSEEFYKDIVDFYNFDNNYPAAQEVQQLYFKCRVASIDEFCSYFVGDVFKKHLELLQHSTNLYSNL